MDEIENYLKGAIILTVHKDYPATLEELGLGPLHFLSEGASTVVYQTGQEL